MPLPEQISLRYSDEDAGYVSMRPVVRQTFRLHELIDMIVTVVGRDPDRVRQILRTGTVVYNSYRYTWDSLSADPAELTTLLASFPDDDPSRPFDPSKASAVLLESGGGTQRRVTELSRHDASSKKLFAKDSPWNVLLHLAAADPPASPLPTTIRSNFRLLLGLTSLDSIRCFSHFFSSGPDGIFESNVVAIGLPDNSKKDCEGNRNVTGENQPGQGLTTNRNEVR